MLDIECLTACLYNIQLSMNHKILIFVGVSGSGKSALSKKLAEEHGLVIKDVIEYVEKYLAQTGEPVLSEEMLRKAYEEFITDLSSSIFDILEIANDWLEDILPRIIGVIRKTQKTDIALVFCHCGPETLAARIAARGRLLPDEFVPKQAKYGQEFFMEMSKSLEIQLIDIDTEKSFADSYRDLLRLLELLR